MNLFRIKRKSNKKFGLKKFILIILLLMMTTLAWFTYTRVLNNNLSVLVGSWNIKFYEMIKDEDGNEIEGNEIDNLLQVHLKDLYPGMEDEVVKVKIRNNGLTDASISCSGVKGSCYILGKPYDLLATGQTPLTDYYITLTESIKDETKNLTTWNFIDKTQTLNDGTQRFPFSITIEYASIIKRKSEGMLTITTKWEENKESINELDTQWGHETGLFIDKVVNGEIKENTNPVNFVLLVNAILPRAVNP